MIDVFLDSLIGLGLLAVVTLVQFIFSRRTTIPFSMTVQIAASLIACLFGWPVIIYSVLFLALVIFIKYYNMTISEKPDIDYSGSVFSLSRLPNKLKKASKDEIIIGKILPVTKKELRHNKSPIKLNSIILSGGTLITGSTGSGKTTTMLSIMKQAISKGTPVVFFDYKGENGILESIEAYCKQKNIQYYEFSNRDCTFSYDPLINLNATGKIEALMNTRRWDASGADEHYKTSTQLVIQNVIRAYDDYRKEHNETCNYLVGLQQFTYSYKPALNERDGFNTLSKQLEILLSSRAKDMLLSNKQSFSFEDMPKQFVICFSFISANKALANSLSSFIFQDIMDRGTRKHYDPKLLLCIDEFGTLESSTLIKDILEKGRSGGCQTIFSILDINQIAMNAGEYFVNAILGTINSFIIHAGATQSTADLLAGVQKYDNKGYSIMDLRKPYKAKAPTALFISKYPILSKRGNQEVYRMEPYTFKDRIVVKNTIKDKETTLDFNEPAVVKNVDDWL